ADQLDLHGNSIPRCETRSSIGVGIVGAARALVNVTRLCYDGRRSMKTLVLLLIAASAAGADEVELTSGTVIEGKVEDLGDSIRVVKSSGSAVYPKSMIRKITPKKTGEELYADKARELKES